MTDPIGLGVGIGLSLISIVVAVTAIVYNCCVPSNEGPPDEAKLYEERYISTAMNFVRQ